MDKITQLRRDSRIVIAWVTNPYASRSIVECARKIADESKAELMIISIQNSIKNNWSSTMKDLEILVDAAHHVDAELTVMYSDNKMETAFKAMTSVKPVAMVMGVPDTTGKNDFVELLLNYDRNVCVYTVDSHGNALKLG
ncbi:MAG: hypothetical protein IKJ75_00620 [Clostridia bacterium]|nr:hypothetical protein [Clostridia bacterium]